MRLPTWIKLALGTVFLISLGLYLAPYFRGEANPNEVLLTLGGWQIHWYGVLMAGAILICVWQALVINQKQSLVSTDDIIGAATWAVVGGLAGARLIYVLLKWGDYAGNPIEILMIQNGGLSIHGAILGGFVAVWLYTRTAKTKLIPIADLFAVVIPIGQLIGRFGNFFNQEAFGGPTSLPWKMFVDETHRPEGYELFKYFHPTFAYEAIGSAIIFWLLYILYRRQHLPGIVLAAYLILYSGLRFVLEFWRVDSDYLYRLSVAQWASLAIIAIAICWWRVKLRRS